METNGSMQKQKLTVEIQRTHNAERENMAHTELNEYKWLKRLVQLKRFYKWMVEQPGRDNTKVNVPKNHNVWKVKKDNDRPVSDGTKQLEHQSHNIKGE